jgi:signal transduction histidine kinase
MAEKKKDHMVCVSIEDNGIGISECVIKKLFKIDEKVSGIGTEGEVGSGLGLILCDEFTKKNNGRIWAESIEGVGTKMYIEIPNNNEKSRRKTR